MFHLCVPAARAPARFWCSFFILNCKPIPLVTALRHESKFMQEAAMIANRRSGFLRLKAAMSVIVVSLSATSAIAGTSGLGAITLFTAVPSSSNPFFFYTNGARSGGAACATITNRWVIDVSTPSGQATVALVLSAQAQGRSVSVTGTGNCAVWSDTETVSGIDVSIS